MNILEKYKGENVVIGTHGNIMVLIMNFFDSQFTVNRIKVKYQRLYAMISPLNKSSTGER